METNTIDLARTKSMLVGLILAIVFVAAAVLAADGAADSRIVESAFYSLAGLSWH
jgi:hypothetical protein